MKATPLFLVCIMVSTSGMAQADEGRTKNFNTKKGIALEGYDPVSYFSKEPMKGKPAHQTTYKGVTYLFATSSNLEAFKKEPDLYEPVFGGWCAYAMGDSGDKVKIDPETFKILEGRLYVFYNFWGSNTLELWNKNEKTLKAKGEQNWKKFIP